MKTTRRIPALLICVVLLAGMTLSAAERALWDCPRCGHRGNRTDFCAACQWQAPPEGGNGEWVLWTCPGCGQELNWGRFCVRCGRPAPTPEPTEEPAWLAVYKVFYRDEAGGLLNSDTVTLDGRGTVTFTVYADDMLVPAGYVLTGENSAVVTVENGRADPSRVTFVYRNTVTPSPAPTHEPTAAPTPVPTPAPAADLRAGGAGVDRVTVTWNAAPGAEAYRVEVRERGGALQSVGTVKSGEVDLSGLKAGTEYTVRITALSGGLEAAPAEITLRTPEEPKLKPGDYVTLGRYEQDNNPANGQEPMEWLVLEADAEKNRALLLSRYGLEAMPYHTGSDESVWESCSLRAWLNGSFLNTAFTAAERAGIRETETDNGPDQCCGSWSTGGGNNTRDRVFLLSFAEANRYLGVQHMSAPESENNVSSRAGVTVYASARGAYTRNSCKTAEGMAACWWWLRSPGASRSSAAYVSSRGACNFQDISLTDGSVRPALWVDLGAGLF